MKNMFDKKSSGKKFGGGRGATWKRDDDRDARPALHPAVCSKCNESCEVPFKPNGKKPIFCRDCFRKEEGGGAPTSRYGAPRFERSNTYDKPAYRSTPHADTDVAKQLKALNEKMDRILEALTDDDES